MRSLGNGGQVNGYGGYASPGQMNSRDFRTVVKAANILNNKQMTPKQAKAIQNTLNLHGVNNVKNLPASYWG